MFCCIKAINPLLTMMVNLPCLMVSCTNFLRSTCSYTECQLSFQTGSLPYGENYCQLQLLFLFDFTDLLLTSRKLFFSGRSPLFHPLVLLGCSVSHTPSGLRVSYPEPCSISEISGTQQGSGF